jgi:hypothetical protein
MATQTANEKMFKRDIGIIDLAVQVENILVETLEGSLTDFSDAGVLKGVANFIEELEFSACDRFGTGELPEGSKSCVEELNSDFDPVWEIRKEFVIARAAMNRAAAALGASVSDRAKRAERF